MTRSLISDADLAWKLADAARPCLDKYERQMIYIEIGSGDELHAIERILQAVVHKGFELPASLAWALRVWFVRYHGSGFESVFNGLLSELAVSDRDAKLYSAKPLLANPVRHLQQRR